MTRRFPPSEEISSPDALPLQRALSWSSQQRGENVLQAAPSMIPETFSKGLMLDVLEARRCVEVAAASLAATHRTGADLACLEECLSAIAAATNERTRGEFVTAFHRVIVVASDNVMLQQAFDFVAGLFRHELRVILERHLDWQQVATTLAGLLEALREGDGSAAAAYMQEHLQSVEQAVRAWDPDEEPISR